MESQNEKLNEIKSYYSSVCNERQTQLSELKQLFNNSSQKMYKDMILMTSEVLSIHLDASEIKFRQEAFMSIGLSIGKVINQNNSLKSLLLTLKVLEEHDVYYSKKKQETTFIHQMLEKNSLLPIRHSMALRMHFVADERKEKQFKLLSSFYGALYKENDNVIKSFEQYLRFQKDNKEAKKANFDFSDISSGWSKLSSGSVVNSHKAYVRERIVAI